MFCSVRVASCANAASFSSLVAFNFTVVESNRSFVFCCNSSNSVNFFCDTHDASKTPDINKV